MKRNEVLGYVEKVPVNTDSKRGIWYLPHHPVVNPEKPNKLRVVFDCAAKFQGKSLNDRLLQGPDWTTTLIDVLCRFRVGKVALSADIREMFHQVKIPVGERDALRFLWWEGSDRDNAVVNYRMTVHPFGAISSPFCANYALPESANKHSDLVHRTVVESVSRNFYVDDYLGSFDDVESALEQFRGLTRLLEEGGFHPTKWMSNASEVLKVIPYHEKAERVRDLDGSPLPIERTLGIQWDAETDDFVFELNVPELPITRRGILSAVSSLLDPLGFVSPWLLPGKILLQRLCRKKVDWDQSLDRGDRLDWEEFLNTLKKLGDIRIPRCLTSGHTTRTGELHAFSDASEVGYGDVVYGRWCAEDGQYTTRILFVKTPVAPLKSVSIPRLELSAAVLAIKVVQAMKRCFDLYIWSVSFWTDSTIVLYYINNVRSRFSTFVANRLTIIHDESVTHQWSHVRSGDNPADLCSRGANNFKQLDTWTRGPNFLQLPKQDWPVF
nr:unnamed protein product [Fasciola hepatica]